MQIEHEEQKQIPTKVHQKEELEKESEVQGDSSEDTQTLQQDTDEKNKSIPYVASVLDFTPPSFKLYDTQDFESEKTEKKDAEEHGQTSVRKGKQKVIKSTDKNIKATQTGTASIFKD